MKYEDETARRREMARADRVNAFLHDDEIRSVFMELENEAIDTWKASDSQTEREYAHQRYKAVAALQKKLEGIVVSGKMAAQQMRGEKK